MLRWLANRQLDAFERNFQYDATYTRDILNTSLSVFWKFSRIFGMANDREGVPRDAWHTAKILAALSEDCGPCTQLVVTMAERDGVDAATLRAILAGNESAMSPDVALAFRFVRATLSHDLVASDRFRTEIVSRWGRRALVSLALSIASSRVFPTVKYAMGYGHACSQVRVAGANAPFLHHEQHA